MNKSKSKYYKSCGSLPVFNFYKILNTEDLSYLVRDHDVDDEPIVFTEEELVELSSIWFEITSEYNELFGEKINTNNYVIIAQISQMAQELEIVSTMLSLYSVKPSEKLKMALKEWKYDVEDMDKCKKKLDSLKFRMEFTAEKNKALFERDEKDKGKKYKLYDDVVRLENSMGITIDVHKTVLEKWAALILKNDELIKAQRKNSKK